MSTVRRSGAGNFAPDPARASRTGSKGGVASGGNFKHRPGRARVAGRKGGLISCRGPKHEV